MKPVRATVTIMLLLSGTAAIAQSSNTARTRAEAYGARLGTPADPTAQLNARRYNSRISNRVTNRISLRIERYRDNSSVGTADAYRQATNQTSTTRAFEQMDTAAARAQAAAEQAAADDAAAANPRR